LDLVIQTESNQRLEVYALQILHDDRTLPVDGREILHPNNVPVMEQPQHPRLIARTLNDFFVPDPLSMQKFDRNDRLEVVARDHLGQIHFSKGSFSELL
jgi:hypothetical protein